MIKNLIVIDYNDILDYVEIEQNSSSTFGGKDNYKGIDIHYIIYLSISDGMYNVSNDTCHNLCCEMYSSNSIDCLGEGVFFGEDIEKAMALLVTVNRSFSNYLWDSGITGDIESPILGENFISLVYFD